MAVSLWLRVATGLRQSRRGYSAVPHERPSERTDRLCRAIQDGPLVLARATPIARSGEPSHGSTRVSVAGRPSCLGWSPGWPFALSAPQP